MANSAVVVQAVLGTTSVVPLTIPNSSIPGLRASRPAAKPSLPQFQKHRSLPQVQVLPEQLLCARSVAPCETAHIAVVVIGGLGSTNVVTLVTPNLITLGKRASRPAGMRPV